MTRKPSAVGVRNAMLRNHLSSPTAYISCIQITRHFQFDKRKSTVTEKYTQGRLPYIAHLSIKTNKKFWLYFITNELQYFYILSMMLCFLSIYCGVVSTWHKSTKTTNSALMKWELVRNAWVSKSGSVAEWSKALVLGTSLFGGVGSNPTAAKFHFWIMRTLVVYSWIKTSRYAIEVHRRHRLLFNQNMLDSCFYSILQSALH